MEMHKSKSGLTESEEERYGYLLCDYWFLCTIKETASLWTKAITLIFGYVAVGWRISRRESFALLKIRFEALPGPPLVTSGVGPTIIIFHSGTGVYHEV